MLHSGACLPGSASPYLRCPAWSGRRTRPEPFRVIITDPSNAGVPKAEITVINENTALRRTVESNEDGVVPPSVPADRGLLGTGQERGIPFRDCRRVSRLEILQVRTVDFTLQVGAVTETVTVQGEAAMLEAETSQAGEVIKTEQVTNLPLGRRNFMQLTFLTPMSTPATRDFRSTEIGRGTAVPASAGQRPEQNNYQIDGIDNRENGRSSYAIAPPVDSISEFKVQTGLAPAEFGKGGGTIINVVTRSGTNAFHGTLYEFLRNDIFDARPYFAATRALSSSTSSAGLWADRSGATSFSSSRTTKDCGSAQRARRHFIACSAKRAAGHLFCSDPGSDHRSAVPE